MKKFIIATTLFVATAVIANAQTLASAAPIADLEKKEATTAPPAAPAPTIKYEAPTVQTATMNVESGYVYFTNMPERGDINMYLTDARGNIVNKKIINSRRSKVDISRLDKGVHFITLQSDYTGLKKTFMLSLQ